VKRIGILGVSEGNGHPFSYSAIVNGYSDEGLAAAGWPGIYQYVRRRHPSEFGMPGGWRITHAWTQDAETTRRLCAASRIDHAAGDYRDLVGQVDALIVARDDHEQHFEMARPFLEAGTPVFIDKPLSLSLDDLRRFQPYLESGQLMSCSGMRYARELDEPRANFANYRTVKLIRGAIVLSWEKYGVHLLEAILNVTAARPVWILMAPVAHASTVIGMSDDSLVEIDALGESAPVFRVEIFGTALTATFDITDNFSMFRRMLWEFVTSIDTKRPAIAADHTLTIMRALIAGRISRQEKRTVLLDEIAL
jgi:hypothetical protein